MTDQVIENKFARNLVVACLKTARDLIAQGWTQGACARDVLQNAVGAKQTQACAWCAYGALIASTYNEAIEDACIAELSIDLPPSGGKMPLAIWNDEPSRTQADVLERFSITIERLMKDDNR